MDKYAAIENPALKEKIIESDKVNNIVKFYKLKENILTLKTNFQKVTNFKIYIDMPTKSAPTPLLKCNIKYFDTHIIKLNSYVETSTPTLRRLLARINKEFLQYDILDDEIAKSLLNRYYNTNVMDITNQNLNRIDINSKDILINEYCRIRNLVNIIPHADNIYEWNIYFSQFSNESLMESLKTVKNNEIKIKILFTTYYPFYPPQVKVIRPYLKHNLAKNITDLKLLKFEYWSPSVDIHNIISKIYNILEAKAVIDSTISKYSKIENSIMRLENLYDVVETLDVGPCILFNGKKEVVQVQQKIPSKMNGTGYGDNSDISKWDPAKYMEIQKKKDEEIISIINEIIMELDNATIDNLKSANLMSHIKKMLNTTLFDIGKREDTYKLIFNLLANIVHMNDGITLFDDIIVNIIKELADEISSINKLSSSNDSNILFETICSLNEMLKSIETKKITINTDSYFNALDDLKFDICTINVGNFRTLNKVEIKETNILSNAASKRVARELSALKKTIQVHFNSSIFVRVHEKNTRFIRVLITGPDNTPYDSGVFIFDLYITDIFPEGPPSLKIVNGANKRLNPNLYADGKVCLSLLGTWQGESWDAQTSSLIQLLISVQAQILVPHPYFNEPGYQREYGTEQGDKSSKKYNTVIQYYVMNNIYDSISNPGAFPEFKQVIENHFKEKKNYIIKLVDKWVSECSSSEYKPKFIEIANKIKTII